MAMEAANSSSIWMKMPPTVGMRAANLSTTSVEGVIGYPAANRAPAARAPSQQAWSPSRKCAPVRTPFGSACMAGSVNCEVRAIQATQVATAAFLRGYDVRWVISLGIERRGERKHVSGAKLDTEAAALAALDGDVDGTFGHSGEGVHADGHTELGSDAMPCSARAAQPCVADAGKRNFSASVRMCRLNREQRVSFGMAAAVGIISPQPDLTNTPDLSDTDSAWVNRTEMIGFKLQPPTESVSDAKCLYYHRCCCSPGSWPTFGCQQCQPH